MSWGCAPCGIGASYAAAAIAVEDEPVGGIGYRLQNGLGREARIAVNGASAAVKILRPDVPAGAERFVREIRMISLLVHPFLFFVMPYIEGESRRRLQREGWLEARRHIPTTGCIHQVTGENLRVGSSADSSAWRTS